MEKEIVAAKSVQGVCQLPGDRHVALLVSMAGALAQGDTEIRGFPGHSSCRNLLELLDTVGVQTETRDKGSAVVIHGKGLRGWSAPDKTLQVNDSEILLKLVAGALAGQGFGSKIEGGSYFSMVPMEEIVVPLKRMNVQLAADEDKHLPFTFQPSEVGGIEHELDIMDYGTKACLLLAGLFAKGTSVLTETTASWDHMERILQGFGANIQIERKKPSDGEEDEMAKRIRLAKARKNRKSEDKEAPFYRVSLSGNGDLQGRSLALPGDPTVGASLAVLACISKKSEIEIKGMSLNQSRSGVLHLLRRMGAEPEIRNKHDEFGEPVGDVIMRNARLTGRKFSSDDMVNMIDEVPALAVAAAFAEGQTVIRNIERLRNIDADCISGLTENLRKMGVKVGELPDGLVIVGDSGYQATEFDSYGDSRIGMAFAVAAMACSGTSKLKNAESVESHFPGFFQELEKLQPQT